MSQPDPPSKTRDLYLSNCFFNIATWMINNSYKNPAPIVLPDLMAALPFQLLKSKIFVLSLAFLSHLHLVYFK